MRVAIAVIVEVEVVVAIMMLEVLKLLMVNVFLHKTDAN